MPKHNEALEASEEYAQAQPAQPSTTLVAARKLVAELRDLDAIAVDLEQRLADNRSRAQLIRTKTLVDLMQSAGLRTLGIDAAGNLPAFTAELKGYYKANIAADWPYDRQEAGYAELERLGHGDVIKRRITVDLGKDSEKLAGKIRKALGKLDVQYAEGRTVPWTTLTALIRELHVKKLPLPNLDVVGAVVGQIVEVKPRKEG